jgi:serine/threonine protein kinase
MVLLDDYVLVQQLGAGGMADVYLVRSRSTNERFAVKRILPRLVRDPVRRQLFLRELRNWIDLPEHPHLTACRFFRSVQDQVVIFAEYVEGGSLEQWIREGRIATLEGILDVAIQMAWGLDVAHRKGLIHQDVNPANVLMRDDLLRDDSRLAKMTDFGLAQAFVAVAAGDQAAEGQHGPSPRKRTGVGTPAYCSPEQAAGEPVSPRADVWGWAITVFQMLLGKRTWEWGLDVPARLERCLQVAAAGGEVFRVEPPDGLVAILRRCFRRNPADRWASLPEAASAAIALYQETMGRSYPRHQPVVSAASLSGAASSARRSVAWSEPAVWQAKAARHAGREAPAPAPPAERRPTSQRIRAIEDLIGYDEAYDGYSGLVAQGRSDLEAELADLCREKSLVHQSAGDTAGALVLLDRAISIYDDLAERPGAPPCQPSLARCLASKAEILAQAGKHLAALEAYGRAIALCERRPAQAKADAVEDILAGCYAGMAVTLAKKGDYGLAVQWFDRVTAILEHCVEHEHRADRADELANALRGKAVAMVLQGTPEDRQGWFSASPVQHLKEALGLYDRAMRLYARLGGDGPREGRAVEQARCSVNRGNALHLLADDRLALEAYDAAGAFLRTLDPDATLRERAVTAMNRAVVTGDLHGEIAALGAYEEALSAMECLVLKTGRGEWANELALGCLNKAIALRTLGDDLEALVLLDRAIPVCQRLVHHEGRREFVSDLAACYTNRAVSAANRGQISQAAELFDRAMSLWDEVAATSARGTVLGDRALCLMNQGTLHWRKGDARSALALFDRALEALELPWLQRTLPELAADAVFCHLNKALVFCHQNKRRSAARALGRAESLLNEHEGLRERAILKGPVTGPLLDFVRRCVRGRSASASRAPALPGDPKRAFNRTRKRLIHLL